MKTTTTTTKTAKRFSIGRKALAGLVGVAAAAGVVGMASSPAHADICVGKKLYVEHDYQKLYGTCGDDLIFVGNHKGVTVYAGDGNDDIRGGWGYHDVYIYAGKGNDKVSTSENTLFAYGEEGHDTLKGSYGDDRLWGGDGNDTIEAGQGKNYLEGGAGNDTFNSDDYGNNQQFDQIYGGTGDDTATHETFDLVYQVEHKHLAG